MKLLYNNPPSKIKLKEQHFVGFDNLWEQTALPLGNGNLGISVIGEVQKDMLVFNHKTLWTGGPSPKRPDYCGGNITAPDQDKKLPRDYYKEIYTSFKNGDNQKAHQLCEKLVGIKEGYGSYRPFGTFNFDFGNISQSSLYCRELDLENAVCTVEYDALFNDRKIHDKRIYFTSNPQNCGVIKTLRTGGSLNTVLSVDSSYGEIEYKENKIVHKGSVEDNGLNFCLVAEVFSDGKVTDRNNGIEISDATEFTVIFSADTDYSDTYPTYRTGETQSELFTKVSSTVNIAKNLGFDNLLKNHKKDFNNLFNRVNLTLNSNTNLTADKLLETYAQDKQCRKKSIELLYAYGRYLTISSSRENDLLPSNLQGIWNCHDKPAWGCDYHININLQMNYWPTFSANLAECAKPLIRYIEAMTVPGRITAEYYTGVKSTDAEHNGFLFHTQCTPFGWTCPGWSFDWGWSPAAVPWILHNCYEYYEYTLDKQMLADHIYPMLKETAEYFSKLLIEHNGRLLTCPCFSPEHGPRTLGNTYEQSLIWQLYDDALKSAKALEIDNNLAKKWRDIQDKLNVYEIGEDGQIKEWYHETSLGEIGQKHHRHMSHLLGLYPCNVMNKFDNPELVKAAVVSMNDRTDKSTGWSMGQKINTWARTGDGDRVLKIIGDLFESGIYSNFFDYHPPFQIDGNFGFTAGVNEMLLQSNCGFIELLPALPTEWDSGSVCGLIARGNFTVNIKWSNGKLTEAEITSNMGGVCTLHYNKSEFTIAGICDSKNNFAKFQTEKGKTYKITVCK